METEAMATRQTSKPTKTKSEAKVDTDVINKPVRNRKREAERRNPQVRSRSAAAGIDHTGAKAAAADGAVAENKPEQTGSRWFHRGRGKMWGSHSRLASPSRPEPVSGSGHRQQPTQFLIAGSKHRQRRLA